MSEDGRVRVKEDEKVEKNQDLRRQIQKMWGVRTKVIPIVVGALATIPLRLKENLRTIGLDISIELIHSDLPFWGWQEFLEKCWRCRQKGKKNEGCFLVTLGNWFFPRANENQI